ncbi:MAG TPA: serine/threonine-protein kinase [Polyangia bacterium]|jgi:serine/threonine-protein kinase
MGNNGGGTHDPTIDRRHGDAAGSGDLPEGMQVGEYRVLRKIGEGGMGAVYAAVQPVIGKRVAIKVLAPHIAKNPELVRRFVDEARAVNKIGHPNIVDIFSFGWLPDKRHYFAMEFLDGHSLADRMKRGPFQPDEARRLLRQICQALEAAHRQGIVHRDLKPDNIWVVQPQHGDSYAKLLDFGIAKLMGDVDEGQRTQTGIVMGTPAYMSPEQCRGVNVGKGTDIYALGMILYEMFAGQLPFKGSFAELITHHLMTVPEAPSRHRPMPRALEQLIMRCLEKDAAHRPQSAEELAGGIEAALSAAGADAATAAVVPVVPLVQGSAVAPASPPGPEPPRTDPPGDTLAPPPGRTAADLTMQPARSRRPLLWAGVVGVGVLAAVLLALQGRHGGGDRGPLVVVADAQAPSTGAPAKPMPGRAHVVVKGADVARVLVDGKLVAAGVREARILDLAPGEPHALRVEAVDRAPHERAFTVAAGAEAELEVSLAPAAAAAPETHPPPHARRHETPGPAATAKTPPTAPPAPGPGASKPRHRDGLVGDDIFDSK